MSYFVGLSLICFSLNFRIHLFYIFCRIFRVVWGKPTAKKHKTWEGDGTLELGEKTATLKVIYSSLLILDCFVCMVVYYLNSGCYESLIVIFQDEDGKVLGRATQVKTMELEEGSRLKVGSKEVEVCRINVEN